MFDINAPDFTDEHGRTLILRGVNLGGSSKVPRVPDGATYRREGFFDHRNVSFVGRPFPLHEADEHFKRLRAWGFTLLRFIVTWEAIEHTAPGVYDEAYLDYVYAIVERAGHYGFEVFIDPHQDVWSRFSGGDGAPGWTLEAAGFDITQLHATSAAILHQLYDGALPRMIWPTNMSRLAAATMFTLFFGGNDFAPATRVDGEPIQDYLQRHYIAAICKVAERLKDMRNVAGYDTLNEPLSGYIGSTDLRRVDALLKSGALPSPYQAMLLGAGYPQDVEEWETCSTGFKRIGTRTLNAQGARAWLPGRECVWRENGVWDVSTNERIVDDEPRLLHPDYFARRNDRSVDFPNDYYLPFAQRYTAAIRAIDPKAIIFVECAIGHPPPHWDAPNIVFAPHWYDGMVLFTKSYNDWLALDLGTGKIVLAPWRIRRSFAQQLARHRVESAERLKNAPVLMGEFGIPFDMQDKRAYHSGDFKVQLKALDRTFHAFEDTLMSGTLWNYTSDNSNAHGDLWNDEDLSIFSRDQQSDPSNIDSGGRALAAVVRPYARATAGEPLRMRFDRRRRIFDFEFRHDPHLSAPTELFVPDLQYPHGYKVTLSDGSYETQAETQTLIYHHTTELDKHTLRIQPVFVDHLFSNFIQSN